jgi:hypothetical protein
MKKKKFNVKVVCREQKEKKICWGVFKVFKVNKLQDELFNLQKQRVQRECLEKKIGNSREK